MRSGVLTAVLAVAVLTAGPAAAATPPRAPAKPNIVLLLTDDQTVADMAVMPQTRKLIGAAGTTFANSFVSYPLCCPSRTTIFTGQYAHNHKVLGNLPPRGGYGALAGKGNMLPVWLQKAGYFTSHLGKYLNGYGRDVPADIPPGWSDWRAAIDPSAYLMWGYTLNENGVRKTYGAGGQDPALYQTDVLRDKAVDLIARRAPSKQPFFLSVAFLAPHSEAGRESGNNGPIVRAAPRDAGAFAGAKVPRGPAYDEADVSDKPPFFAKAFPPLTEQLKGYTENSFRSRRASLLAVDDAVAAIVGQLRSSGELENTLILFASDNGFFLGEHRVALGKYLAYEPSIRVPLLVRGPGVARGKTSSQMVMNPDWTATFVAAARAKAGRTLDGESLLPFAADPKKRERRSILLETTQRGGSGDLDQDVGSPQLGAPQVPPYQGVRTDRFVYIQHATGELELYDLQRDPNELQSRAADPAYAATRRALAKELTTLARCKGSACRAPGAEIPGPTR